MSDHKGVADGLSNLLADSYVLYLKTHNFHWNVTGPMFNSLHLLFEQEYTELALAIDEIAERIRALGHPAPGSFTAYAELASVEEAKGVPSAEEMLEQLANDQLTIVATARKVLAEAEKEGDAPTVDLLTRRMEVHEKNAWMLRSSLP